MVMQILWSNMFQNTATSSQYANQFRLTSKGNI